MRQKHSSAFSMCVGILKFTGTRVKSEVSEVCKKFLFFYKKIVVCVFKIIRGMI